MKKYIPGHLPTHVCQLSLYGKSYIHTKLNPQTKMVDYRLPGLTRASFKAVRHGG